MKPLDGVPDLLHTAPTTVIELTVSERFRFVSSVAEIAMELEAAVLSLDMVGEQDDAERYQALYADLQRLKRLGEMAAEKLNEARKVFT